MLTGFAHSAVCVPDVEAATRWYSEVLGLEVLSAPYRMEGAQIEHDMGELIPSPVVVHAAIVGFGRDDRVIELIEYPVADVAGLRTTWCSDPWGTVIILMEKREDALPYWGQWMR